MAREQIVMFPNNSLIPAEVLKQKLARRTKRPESAKLSDRTGRAKVGKTQCESLNMAPLAWSKKVIILIPAGLLKQKLKRS